MSTGSYADNPIMKGDDPDLVELYGDRTAVKNCQYLLPHIKPTSIILDVGCGPGRITTDFATLATLGKVTGLDSNEVLLHLRDPITALKEFHRVLKPSGLLAVRENTSTKVLSLSPDLPSLRAYWEHALELMPKSGMDVFAGEKLAGWVKEAGFERVVTSTGSTYLGSHLSQVTGKTSEIAVQYGMATVEELEAWRVGWEEYEGTEGCEFVLEAGEVLAFKE